MAMGAHVGRGVCVPFPFVFQALDSPGTCLRCCLTIRVSSGCTFTRPAPLRGASGKPANLWRWHDDFADKCAAFAPVATHKLQTVCYWALSTNRRLRMLEPDLALRSTSRTKVLRVEPFTGDQGPRPQPALSHPSLAAQRPLTAPLRRISHGNRHLSRAGTAGRQSRPHHPLRQDTRHPPGRCQERRQHGN